ncbi:cysteine hydrolase family protein [Cytobacillus firmus]|uniref:cysteine hydrolase family protein n=1 Tax=Cytobacillus firmus TaxID=1399 RepID=UPI0021619EFC|nr:cysteine hydrolase family protein [Cytobacillus firmus]MCS0653511.1 cysteine hydrolase [Cytobacillus firmus]WHY32394.1 cysteine hydrolase family protein [Cytobacillus firmus]
MNRFPTAPALLVLDMQKGFDDPYWGKRNNPQAENNAFRLLTEWRKRKWPIFFSKHLSLDPQSPLYHKNEAGIQFNDLLAPKSGEQVFTKNVNSAFIGTELEMQFRQQQIESVVITGLSTQHCVSTTTRMSANLGFITYLVSDAVAAFDITDHKGVVHSAKTVQELELAALHKEFAVIVTSDEVINQLSSRTF